MDENLPDYFILGEGDEPNPSLSLSDDSPSPGPLVSVIRLGELGDEVSCADVRAAAY